MLLKAYSWIVSYAVVPLLLVALFILTYAAGAFASYVQLVLTLPLLIWVFVQPQRWRSEAAGLLGLIAFLILLAIFTATNPAGRTDYLYALNFVLFLLMGPLIAAFSQFASPRNVLIIARLALAGTVVTTAWALWQVYGLGLDHAQGLVANRITSTGAAVVIAFIAGLGFFTERGPRRFLYLGGPVLAVLIVYLATSRGPVLVLLAVLTVLLFALFRRKWLALALGGGLALIVAASFLLFPSAFGRLAKLPTILAAVFTGADLGDESADIRFRLYQAGWRAFMNSPWIGHGWGEKAMATIPEYREGDFDRDRWHLHSDILDFAVSGGVVGLIAYGLMLAAPIIGAWRSVRDSQYGVRMLGTVLLVVAFVVYGAFNLALGFEYFTTLYVLTTAILLGYCRDEPMRASSVETLR